MKTNTSKVLAQIFFFYFQQHNNNNDDILLALEVDGKIKFIY